MKTAYFDCFCGVAGDMILGAMIDAGLPLAKLKKELKKVDIHGYKISVASDRRQGIAGKNLHVEVSHDHSHHHHSTYKDIKRLISKSKLSCEVKETAIAIFETLAIAEGKVHRRKKDAVHFHEVGGVDSVVDIVGAAIGFAHFKFDAIYSSPLPVTRGWVKCAHGMMPIPAPATLEILKGVPIYPSPVKRELVTPTGAAILKTVARGFCENPVRMVKRISYGFGDSIIPNIPNGLRLIVGDGAPLVVIETNIDDMNPEIYDHVIDLLIGHGAIDVTLRPVLMKKRRTAAQLQILCEEDVKDSLIDVVLRETSTIGVRWWNVERTILDREIIVVRTKYGPIKVKIARTGNEVLNFAPEYNSCRATALRRKVPLKMVYLEALRALDVV